jgi:hypothetical protein
MTPRSLKILVASSWVGLLVCVLMFFYFAIAIPNVISERIIEDEDKDVQQIRSSTDLHEVQQIASWRTQEEAYISGSAGILLRIAVATFLLCGICASISLWQLRHLRRYLEEAKAQPLNTSPEQKIRDSNRPASRTRYFGDAVASEARHRLESCRSRREKSPNSHEFESRHLDFYKPESVTALFVHRSAAL